MNSENITDRLRYIEISVGRSFEDDVTGEIQTDSGTHLIVFPYETECGDNSFSSDPAIINYYRQFFMRFEGEIRGMKFGFCNFRTIKRPIWNPNFGWSNLYIRFELIFAKAPVNMTCTRFSSLIPWKTKKRILNYL